MEVTAESNNVYPKYFKEYEVPILSNILQNEGETALNLELLKMYEQGIFQEGNPNKWSKAIERLKHTREYEKFNWRKSNYNENCPIQAARNSKEYEQVLLNSLKLKASSEKFVLLNNLYPHPVYVLRVRTKVVKYTTEEAKANVFKYKQDAEYLLKMFDYLKLNTI